MLARFFKINQLLAKTFIKTWQEQNKLQERTPEVRLQESTLLRSKQRKQLSQEVE